MGSADESSASQDSVEIAEVRANTLAVVSAALHWQLAKARWQAVEQALAEMEAAIAADDLDAFAAATADLELIAPLR